MCGRLDLATQILIWVGLDPNTFGSNGYRWMGAAACRCHPYTPKHSATVAREVDFVLAVIAPARYVYERYVERHSASGNPGRATPPDRSEFLEQATTSLLAARIPRKPSQRARLVGIDRNSRADSPW